jgi:anti-anti-sigma regulatory factor
MDIRARTLIAFTPLVVLLLSMVLALPIIEQRDHALLEAQVAAADDLTDTQTMGLDLLLEHVAVGQIARAYISPKSERYTVPHAELAQLLQKHTGFIHPSEELDLKAAAIYADLAKRYEEVVAFAGKGNLVATQAIYGNPRTLTLLDSVLSLNQQARIAARASIDQANTDAEIAQRQTFQAITAFLVLGILIAVGLSWALVSQLIKPIERLTADAEHYASGELAGQLSPVPNIGQLSRLRDAFQHLLDANTARQTRIQQSLNDLNDQIVREERLRETVQALSVPVVPLKEDMLLLPMIGHLDARRAAELTRGLLDSIQRHRAKAVVLDITGLADLDTAGSLALRQTADAAQLLGCQVFLVGVRANQALSLAESHLSGADITVARDIPSVLARVARA